MIVYDDVFEADYSILSRIMEDAFNDDTRIHTDLIEDGPCGYDDGTLRKLNKMRDCVTQKICVDSEIIGAYTIKSNLSEYTIEMLFLNPKNKSKGVGYEVWNHIQDTYPDADKWFVETPEYSSRNYHFYVNKCGFTVLKENVHDDGGKSIVFVKVVK